MFLPVESEHRFVLTNPGATPRSIEEPDDPNPRLVPIQPDAWTVCLSSDIPGAVPASWLRVGQLQVVAVTVAGVLGSIGSTLLLEASWRRERRPDLAEQQRPFRPSSAADETQGWLDQQTWCVRGSKADVPGTPSR
jgi:hypothetical protein